MSDRTLREMYWLRPISGACRCGRPATHELSNWMNAPLGRYCRACGKKEVTRLNKAHEEKRGIV